MNKTLARLAAATSILATPALAFAQTTPSNGLPSLQQISLLLQPLIPTRPLSVSGLFALVFQYIILFAGVIAIFYLIWAGIRYITASTNEDEAKKAKTAIFNAIIGIVVIILSYAIVVYVSGFVNTVAPGSNASGSIQNEVPNLNIK